MTTKKAKNPYNSPLAGRVKGFELLPATVHGVRPLKITIEHSSIVSGKAFVTKSQIVVDPRDAVKFPLGAIVTLQPEVSQTSLPFAIVPAEREASA